MYVSTPYTSQIENKRQEKKLRDSESFAAAEAAATSNSSTDPFTQKENQASLPQPSAGKQTRSTRSQSKGRVSRKDGVFDDAGASSVVMSGGGGGGGRAGAAGGKRGPLRGLGNARQQQEQQLQKEGSSALKVSEKAQAALVPDERVDDETPPECAQS